LKGGIAICGAELPDALEDLQEEGYDEGEDGKDDITVIRGTPMKSCCIFNKIKIYLNIIFSEQIITFSHHICITA